MKLIIALYFVFLPPPCSFAGGTIPFGFFPKKKVTTNPMLSWGGGGGIFPGGHEVATLTNTGTGSSGTITVSLNIVSGSFSIYSLGLGDTCSGAVLAPGGSCVVDVEDDSGGTGGTVNLNATDGTFTATPDANFFDCPAC